MIEELTLKEQENSMKLSDGIVSDLRNLKAEDEGLAFGVFCVLNGVLPGISVDSYQKNYESITESLRKISEHPDFSSAERNLSIKLMRYETNYDYFLFFKDGEFMPHYAEAYLESLVQDDKQRIKVTGALYYGIPLCCYSSLMLLNESKEADELLEYIPCSDLCGESNKKKERLEQCMLEFNSLI